MRSDVTIRNNTVCTFKWEDSLRVLPLLRAQHIGPKFVLEFKCKLTDEQLMANLDALCTAVVKANVKISIDSAHKLCHRVNIDGIESYGRPHSVWAELSTYVAESVESTTIDYVNSELLVVLAVRAEQRSVGGGQPISTPYPSLSTVDAPTVEAVATIVSRLDGTRTAVRARLDAHCVPQLMIDPTTSYGSYRLRLLFNPQRMGEMKVLELMKDLHVQTHQLSVYFAVESTQAVQYVSCLAVYQKPQVSTVDPNNTALYIEFECRIVSSENTIKLASCDEPLKSLMDDRSLQWYTIRGLT